MKNIVIVISFCLFFLVLIILFKKIFRKIGLENDATIFRFFVGAIVGTIALIVYLIEEFTDIL